MVSRHGLDLTGSGNNSIKVSIFESVSSFSSSSSIVFLLLKIKYLFFPHFYHFFRLSFPSSSMIKIYGDVTSLTMAQKHIGGVQIKLHTFLTLQFEVSCQVHVLAALSLITIPPGTTGWVPGHARTQWLLPVAVTKYWSSSPGAASQFTDSVRHPARP